ncbi:MAG: hypothetical protein DCC63_14800 [Nitrospira sp.]|nr:MAG: hypothetical protein DCC63_14800 [Nitrospira sp.]
MSKRSQSTHAEPRLIPTPPEFKAHLDRFILGQEKPKRVLSSAVYHHLASLADPKMQSSGAGRQVVLLIGPTGSGKTAMARTIGQLCHDRLGIPFQTIDASEMAGTGYSGSHVDECLRLLFHNANQDIALAERHVLYVDEIDKKRKQEVGGLRDVSGEDVQHALLPVFGGGDVAVRVGETTVNFNTRKLLVIASGAFVGLSDIVRRRIAGATTQMGFQARRGPDPDEISEADLLSQVLPEDLIQYGLIPELVGRFTAITALQPLTQNDLVNVMLSAEDSALAKEKDFFASHGIHLHFTRSALEAIAAKALSDGTGARGLNRSIAAVCADLEFDITELASRGVNKILIGESCITRGAAPVLRKGEAYGTERKYLHLAGDGNGRAGHGQVRVVPAGTPVDLRQRLEHLKNGALEFKRTTDPARSWWLAFERENAHRLHLVVQLAQELASRNPPATITEFFLCYVFSNSNNIQANLHWLDYKRLKDREEHSRRSRKNPDAG